MRVANNNIFHVGAGLMYIDSLFCKAASDYGETAGIFDNGSEEYYDKTKEILLKYSAFLRNKTSDEIRQWERKREKRKDT